MKNIIGIFAHPDDAIIWCGGLLLNETNVGNKVTLFYLFENKTEREEEEKQNATKIGADVFFVQNNKRLMSEKIVEIKPDYIITHWEDDTNYEHRKTFRIVQDLIPDIVINKSTNFKLFSCESSNLTGKEKDNIFTADSYIDITTVFNEKKELIKTYKSQAPDYWIDMIDTQNRISGRRVGVEYAEGYKQLSVLGVIKCSKKRLI